MKNASKAAQSKGLRDHATRRNRVKTGRNTPTKSPAPAAIQPTTEIGNDGEIRCALDTLLSKSLDRDDKGRFVHGRVTTGAESRGFFEDLAPVKAQIVSSVRAQLAADGDDAAPTLLAVIDAFAEAHLLRKATFMQLSTRGGPITNKGRVRGLLNAWSQFFDKELRAAERLGLQRLTRTVLESPREWLEQSSPTSRAAEN